MAHKEIYTNMVLALARALFVPVAVPVAVVGVAILSSLFRSSSSSRCRRRRHKFL